MTISVTVYPNIVTSGGTSQVTVSTSITDFFYVSTDGGSLNPESGDVNEDFEFITTYTAPEVKKTTKFTIYAKHDYDDEIGSSEITVNPAPPIPTPPLSVSVKISPASVTSGETSNVEVSVYVMGGELNPSVSGASVKLSATAGSFNPDSGKTDGEGNFKTTYTAPAVTAPTEHTISARASKEDYKDGSGSDTIAVNPTPPTPPLSVSVKVSPDTITSGETSNIEVLVKLGAEILAGAFVKLSTASGSFTDPIGYTKDDGDGNVNFKTTYKAPVVTAIAKYKISATVFIKDGPTGLGSGMITVKPSAKTLTVTITESPDPVISGETSKVTILVKIDKGNLLAGASVKVSATGGSFTELSGITNDRGIFITTYKAPAVTIPTKHTISATASKDSSIGSGSDTITVKPSKQLSVSVTEFPDPVTSGKTSLVIVHVIDSDSKPVIKAYVKASATGGNLSPEGGETDGEGNFRYTYTAPEVTTRTEYTILAHASKDSSIGAGSDTITVKPPPKQLLVSVTESLDPVISGETSKVTVSVKFSPEEPALDAFVKLSATGGNLNPESGKTNGEGNFTATYKAPAITAPTKHTILADASKDDYTGSGSDTITVYLPSEELPVTITEAPDPVISGETSKVTVHVEFDAELPVRGASVEISAADGSFNPESGTTNDQGNFLTTYTAPEVTTSTEYTISADVSMDKSTGSGTDIITVNPPPKTDYPIALMPVKIETRFGYKANSNPVLKVRIYPDVVHIDTHELKLTKNEETWGQHFWKQSWRASTNEARQKQAWAQLAERFGPQRAAWIARQLEPKNQSERPSAPVSDEQPLRPEPVFPSIEHRDHSWTRAPHTRVLPDRWTVIGYRGGKPVFKEEGKPITDPLPAGPSPTAPETISGDDIPPIDEGMKWMIDFDDAVNNGMGIEIPMTKEQANAGLDLLIVLGIKTSLDSNESAKLLKTLLESHHYVDGLGIVAQGTPTNNTDEAKSGYSLRDPGYEVSYRAERGSDLCTPKDGSDGDFLTAALGIETKVFAHVLNADGVEQFDASHMNTALWPASLGYFLFQMMDSTFQDSDIRRVRRHFIDYVRARGPLSTLRVGGQPYGLLPVTSFDRWIPDEDSEFDQKVITLLRSLRDIWRRSVPKVPHVGRTGDPDADLVEILGMDATSSSYAAREVFGEHYFNNLWGFLGMNLGQYWWAQQETKAREVFRQYNLSWNPRLSRAVFSPYAFPLFGPRVQRGVPSEKDPLSPNYIKWLRESNYETIRDENYPDGTPPNSLLYLLLRQATLLEYAVTSFRIQHRNKLMTLKDFREHELIDIQIDTQTPIVWRQLGRAVPDVTGNIPVGRYLNSIGRESPREGPFNFSGYNNDPDIAEFAEFRKSLAYLEKRPTAILKRLLSETIDLCTYRLDAWLTSYVTKRLRAFRERNATGIYLGGYGWVEDIKPESSRQIHKIKQPQDESGSPLYISDSNKGFIHAPSLAHATTAAILRSGYLSHTKNAKSDLLAIDLSSDRVRLAKWLLDGVRQGQKLGALLGYRFERGLHENPQNLKLDQFISSFRALYPLEANKLIRTKDAVENIAANNVVDGLKLLNSWKKKNGSQGIPFGSDDLKVNDEQRGAIEAELNALEYAVDAVSDVMISESIYQVVQGNHLRAGATVDAISNGEVPPPELEVVRSARSGIALTHRIVVLFNGNPPSLSKWPTNTRQARASVEPQLNAWAAYLLGDPSKVRCKAEYIDPKTNKVIPNVDSKVLRLRDLKQSPLDIIYTVVTSDKAQRSELEQLLAYHAVETRPRSVPPNSSVRFSFERESDWAEDDITFPQFIEMARTAREAITSARAIDARDLSLPKVSADTGMDPTELGKRADKAVADFRSAYDTLNDFVKSSDTDKNRFRNFNLTEVRDKLLRMAHFGMQGAVPLSTVNGSTEDDRATLLIQCKSIVDEANKRLENVTAIKNKLNSANPLSEVQKVELYMQLLHEVFGRNFIILPQFKLPITSEVAKAFGDSKSIQGGDELAVITWFQRIARIRKGASRLDSALMYNEALHGGDGLDFIIGQLPYQQDDRWVGLPLEKDGTLLGGRLSLVAHMPWHDPLKPAINPQKFLSGLLIDEWVETVPNMSETTAISFHYDAPGACAPQAILLAVPPDPNKTWDLDTLEAVVLETLELAKMRGVDPDALGELGHYLPALYFANNVEGEAVATDFMRAAKPDPEPFDPSSQMDGERGYP